MKTLVHLSDLHVGRDAETARRTRALSATLTASVVDHVAVTGNLTWTGRESQLAAFHGTFAPLSSRGRLTLVPGNHDRLGDDVARTIQAGPRVSVVTGDGLHLVRFDSTGPEDAPVPRARGRLTDEDVDAINGAVATAPDEALVVLLMHHPVLALLHEHAPERLLSSLARGFDEEMARGRRLVQTLRGRCDLLLHGQRRDPSAIAPFPDDQRPLLVCAAGSSAELGRVRLFSHQAGRMVGAPTWLAVGPPTRTEGLSATPRFHLRRGHFAPPRP